MTAFQPPSRLRQETTAVAHHNPLYRSKNPTGSSGNDSSLGLGFGPHQIGS
jgi:hypothetical protein